MCIDPISLTNSMDTYYESRFATATSVIETAVIEQPMKNKMISLTLEYDMNLDVDREE